MVVQPCLVTLLECAPVLFSLATTLRLLCAWSFVPLIRLCWYGKRPGWHTGVREDLLEKRYKPGENVADGLVQRMVIDWVYIVDVSFRYDLARIGNGEVRWQPLVLGEYEVLVYGIEIGAARSVGLIGEDLSCGCISSSYDSGADAMQ